MFILRFKRFKWYHAVLANLIKVRIQDEDVNTTAAQIEVEQNDLDSYQGFSIGTLNIFQTNFYITLHWK